MSNIRKVTSNKSPLEEIFNFTRGTHDGLWYYRPRNADEEDEWWTGGFASKELAYAHALTRQ